MRSRRSDMVAPISAPCARAPVVINDLDYAFVHFCTHLLGADAVSDVNRAHATCDSLLFARGDRRR